MELLEFSADEKKQIETELHSYFNKLIRNENDFYLKDFFVRLRDFISPTHKAGGPAKRIRPQILIYTFFGIASDENAETHLDDIRKLSLSIELLHNASIIHDDVVNQDEYRRGLSTFHCLLRDHFKERNQNNYGNPDRWGRGVAIHGGDICAFLGNSIINESKFNDRLKFQSIREFNNGFNGIVRGKIIEHYLMTNSLENSTMEDYIMMAGAKTSQQFNTAASIGAILADARISQIQPLKNAMSQLGVAYHIKNDINDTFREKKRNIMLKKRNILLITAYKNASSEDKKTIDQIFNTDDNMTEDQADKIRNIIVESGAYEFSKIYANNLMKQAENEIEKIYPGLREESDQFFKNLIGFVQESL